jgi:hypothetical protein
MDLITFNCSACQQVLKVSADNAGKQAKCPRCGALMVIPGPRGAPGPGPGRPYQEDYPEDRPRGRPRREDDYDDRGRGRGRGDDYEDDRPRGRRDRYEDEYDDRGRPPGMSERKKWGWVQLGILLVAIAACVFCAGGGLLAVAHLITFIQSVSKNPGSGTAAKVIGRIGNGLMFGGTITAVVGYVFCVFVPNRQGTLPLAIVALALGGVNLIFGLLGRIIPMFNERTQGGEIVFPGAGLFTSRGGSFALALIFYLLFFAEMIIFPIFLLMVAKVKRARWLSGNYIGIVIFAGVTALLTIISLVLWFILAGKFSKGLLVTCTVLSLVSALAFLGQMIWYTITLFRSRGIIEG